MLKLTKARLALRTQQNAPITDVTSVSNIAFQKPIIVATATKTTTSSSGKIARKTAMRLRICMDLYAIAFESFEYGKSLLIERLISCPPTYLAPMPVLAKAAGSHKINGNRRLRPGF